MPTASAAPANWFGEQGDFFGLRPRIILHRIIREFCRLSAEGRTSKVLRKELALCRQSARWKNGSHPRQPDQHLPQTRYRSAALSHTTARQPANYTLGSPINGNRARLNRRERIILQPTRCAKALSAGILLPGNCCEVPVRGL